MRILALSDQVVEQLYSPLVKERFGDVDLVVGCGDLPSYYLDYIVSMLNVPLAIVPGNHDLPAASSNSDPDAEGAGGSRWSANIDGMVIEEQGLLLAGLGGSIRYRPDGSNQYTQAEMTGRVLGLAPRLYSDGQSMKWSKLLTNLVANASSAILGWTPRQVFEHPGLYRLEIEALRETVRVMRVLGLRVVDLPAVPTALLSRAVFWPPRLTGPLLRRAVISGRGDKLPSFNYDIGRGRSEVGWLNGAVAATSMQHGLRAPANSVLTETLTGLVDGMIDPSEYRGRPDVLLGRAANEGLPGLPRYNRTT